MRGGLEKRREEKKRKEGKPRSEEKFFSARKERKRTVTRAKRSGAPEGVSRAGVCNPNPKHFRAGLFELAVTLI